MVRSEDIEAQVKSAPVVAKWTRWAAIGGLVTAVATTVTAVVVLIGAFK